MFISINANTGVTLVLPDLEAACELKSSQIHTHSICSMNVSKGGPDIFAQELLQEQFPICFSRLFSPNSQSSLNYPNPDKRRKSTTGANENS